MATARRSKSTAASSVLDNAVLADAGDLASKLPESLSIDVKLPAQVRRKPAHEAAVAIETSTVDPGIVDTVALGTTSIEVIHTGPVHVDPVDDEPVFGRPETSEALTAERLIVGRRARRAAPEGRWPAFVFAASLHLVNLGDSRAVRERKELDARIAKPFEGGTRFVPMLTRKGGVGKTTISRCSAWRWPMCVKTGSSPSTRTPTAERSPSASTSRPARRCATGDLGRVDRASTSSRRSSRGTRPASTFSPSDSDPMVSEAFDENDYTVVADLGSRFYSVVITDCGTGIVHSVDAATLQRADAVVIVSGGSVDEARSPPRRSPGSSRTATATSSRTPWSPSTPATQGTNLVKLEEIEAHFRRGCATSCASRTTRPWPPARRSIGELRRSPGRPRATSPRSSSTACRPPPGDG